MKLSCFNQSGIILTIFLWLAVSPTHAKAIAPPQTIAPTALKSFEQYPPNVQTLIKQALALTTQNLTYQYGSADPNNAGMDCSGTIYYLLQHYGQPQVPRQSDEIYNWVVAKGKFHAVTAHRFDSEEFAALKPGDLLFWTGTYAVNRPTGVSHVMLYLGKNLNDQPLMFGASNGRTYQGKQIWGVSVFDFVLPKENATSRFIGYSCIPNVTCD